MLFAYGGWQTANFIGGEIRDPRRNLPRALLIGVCGVIALYVLIVVLANRHPVDVNFVGKLLPDGGVRVHEAAGSEHAPHPFDHLCRAAFGADRAALASRD